MKRNDAIREKIDNLCVVYQSIGAIGVRLRRCRTKSSRSKQYWEKITKLENYADELKSEIHLAIDGLP